MSDWPPHEVIGGIDQLVRRLIGDRLPPQDADDFARDAAAGAPAGMTLPVAVAYAAVAASYALIRLPQLRADEAAREAGSRG